MRAKTINEVQNFERGQNPKRALGIGGFDLSADYNIRMEDFKKEVEESAKDYKDTWVEFLRKNLIGKTITAKLTSMPGINKETGKTTGKRETGEFTIILKDILPSYSMGDDFSIHLSGSPLSGSLPTLIVADNNNKLYQMDMNQKISVE